MGGEDCICNQKHVLMLQVDFITDQHYNHLFTRVLPCLCQPLLELHERLPPESGSVVKSVQIIRKTGKEFQQRNIPTSYINQENRVSLRQALRPTE